MSGPKSLPVRQDFDLKTPQPGKSNNTNQAPFVLLNGLPLRTTYLAKCRLCLSDQVGEGKKSIMDERFSIMLNHVFRFPITFKQGLPLNACTKCYKGVELFYRYTYHVLSNQKTMEESLNSQENMTNEASPRPAKQRTDTNHGQGISNVVDITSDDEYQRRNDDNQIDVDMQCDPASDAEEISRDSFAEPSNFEDIQTHFVAVPGIADIFLGAETDGIDSNKKPSTKPVEDAPLVIEIVSASDDEYETDEDDESAKSRNHNRTKKRSKQTRDSILKQQSNERASSYGVKVKNIDKLKTPKSYITGVVIPHSETNTDGREALQIRHILRNTIKQKYASKPTERFPRRSLN